MEQREQNHANMNSDESRPKSSEAQLKVNGTAASALEQINEKGYATPYLTDGRKVIKAGIQFSTENMTVGEWVIEEQIA